MSWRISGRTPLFGDRFREFHHRWQRVMVLAAGTGALTGLAIVGFESLTVDALLDHVRVLPDAAIVFLPALGLVLAWCALQWLGRDASPSMADEYLREYHGRSGRSDLRAFAGRIAASVATLGTGGALGFEGPSIYIGSSIGRSVQARFHRFFSQSDRRVLLVAGAAAGVAAIFKAPATGAVFALEVPYQQDNAAHAVLPALVGAATSYLVYIAFKGTDPLFRVIGNPGFDARDLLGAVGLGLVCGAGARLFATLAVRAKRRVRHVARVVGGGATLALLALVALVVFDVPLTIGPGYQAISWSVSPGRSTALVALLLALEVVATLATVAGGGAGGLFIPLVVQGWLLGRVVEGVVRTGTSLFPVVGAAAYLGAGYRTPIAAVVFVTEAARGPGFIVPALVATAVSQLLMGRASVASYQLPRRVSSLERRLEQPLTIAMVRPPLVCPADTPLEELVPRFASDGDAIAIIVDENGYAGTAAPGDLLSTPRREWQTTTAATVMKRDLTTAAATWTVALANEVIATEQLEALVVLDDERIPIGVVTSRAIAAYLGEADIDL
ncbi:MAG TPA: chloride channel protein [Acidimicrobiia bacterium]